MYLIPVARFVYPDFFGDAVFAVALGFVGAFARLLAFIVVFLLDLAFVIACGRDFLVVAPGFALRFAFSFVGG